MYKVSFAILIAYFLACSCATTGKAGKAAGASNDASVKDILRNTVLKNLTMTGFFVQKGKIITFNEDSRISLYFTMKFNARGEYLISLRSRIGMEAFRIYLSDDTVLINDRINKNLLCGKPGDFEKLSGLPAALLKISVGDLFINKPVNQGNTNCRNNEIELSDYYMGFTINSKIDCKREKLKTITINSGAPGNYITINYLKFREDSYTVPKKVEINDPGRKIKIVISIDKYLAPWVGDIDFIPGKGYKSKPLI